MNSMDNRTRKKALAVYSGTVGASLLTAVLFESGASEDGWLAVERQTEFVAATLMVLVTMGCIPLSLRLKHLKRAVRVMRRCGLRSEFSLFAVRILLLGVPMLADTLLYYAFVSPRFGYMAIILLLCLLSLYPSADKERKEDRQ